MKTIHIKNITLTEEELFNLVEEHETFAALGNALGIHRATVSKAIKAAYPSYRGKAKLSVGLLECAGKRKCCSCKDIFDLSEFHKCATTPSGHGTMCKPCARSLANSNYDYEISAVRTKMWNEENRGLRNAYTRNREAAKLKRTPAWADFDKIKEIYKNCPKGHHVDHVIPLQGEKVSGLHVETNLQYLTAEENLKKGNKFE